MEIRKALLWEFCGAWTPLRVAAWATRAAQGSGADRGSRGRLVRLTRKRVRWRHLPPGVPALGTVTDREIQEALAVRGYVITREAVTLARHRYGCPSWRSGRGATGGAGAH